VTHSRTLATLALLLAWILPAHAQSEKTVAACVKKYSWTETQCERVVAHKAWIGMTSEMAMESLGAPMKTSSEQTANGETLQVVYREWSFNGMNKGQVVLDFDAKLCNPGKTQGAMSNLYAVGGKTAICVVTAIEHFGIYHN
jgi:hypothetical protein